MLADPPDVNLQAAAGGGPRGTAAGCRCYHSGWNFERLAFVMGAFPVGE